MNDKKDITNLTGLWAGKAKSGSTYHSAIVEVNEIIEAIEKAAEGRERVKIMLFTNKKEKDKQPDLNLCAVPFVPKAEGPRKDYDPDDDSQMPF